MERRPHVAVIDDDPGMCRALKRLLQSADMDVSTFLLGRDALLAIARREPDCVVIDVELPDFKSLDLFDRIRESHPKLPVLIMTAWEDEELRMKAVARGINGFFYKPFNDLVILGSIKAALDRRLMAEPPE